MIMFSVLAPASLTRNCLRSVHGVDSDTVSWAFEPSGKVRTTLIGQEALVASVHVQDLSRFEESRPHYLYTEEARVVSAGPASNGP